MLLCSPHQASGSLRPWILPGLCLAALLCFAAAAAAQRGPGGPGGPGRSPGPFPGGPPPGGSTNASPNGSRPGGANEKGTRTAPGGPQLGPTGRWWNDKQWAKTVGLNTAQQRRMDEVFNSNKDALIAAYMNLKHEEAELAKASHASTPDEKLIDQGIDRVAQARAELTKEKAHMTLALRKTLTPEQTAKLDELSAQQPE